MREEEIKGILADEIGIRQERAKDLMEGMYEKQKQIYIKTFVNLVDSMFKECINLQRRGGEIYVPDYEERKFKGRVKYIRTSYMMTSIEDGTYEYLVRMHDDIGYFDRFEVEGRFSSIYKKDCMVDDEEYFKSLIMNKVVRAKKYEVKDFLRSYIMDTFIIPMPYEIEDSIDEIRELESYKDMQKDERLSVTYGELNNKYYSKFLLYMNCKTE